MIDLYSDTQSLPTEGMRDAIRKALVGDEQKGTDPTVARLLEAVSGKLGKEAAIFLPSGTMCNVIAIASQCDRGDAAVVEIDSHMMRYEAGGMSAISGVVPEVIQGVDGQFTADQLKQHYHNGSRYTPKTTLVAVEQTCNLAGGTVWSPTELNDVAEAAKKLGMKTHMDGARLFNAALSSGVPAAEHCRNFESVWVDFTKAMGAPFGAVLCGSREFIDRSWRWKHRLGGAMRQAGMMAAGCLYALENNVDRLEVDHINANDLNEGLKLNPFVKVAHEKTATNIVYFSIVNLRCTTDEFVRALHDAGLKIGFVGRGLRAVTYTDISAADIKEAIEIIGRVTRRFAPQTVC